jgi:2-(1,2-epoxy-1,2-dihydrophenyl)acetyl-CoA isomerase
MLDLTLTNRVLSATEAEAWGLVNRIVPDDEVDTATAALAQQLADGATLATGLAKRIVYQGYELGLADAGELEARTITQVMGGHDAYEGIAAFVEKRAAEFRGE